MSTKQVQEGKVLNLTAGAGGATVNTVHVMTKMIGVNLETVASGALQPVAIEGVWTLNKTSGQAYTVGQQVYSTSTGLITSVATTAGNVPAGYAVKAAATGDATAEIKLLPF